MLHGVKLRVVGYAVEGKFEGGLLCCKMVKLRVVCYALRGKIEGDLLCSRG